MKINEDKIKKSDLENPIQSEGHIDNHKIYGFVCDVYKNMEETHGLKVSKRCNDNKRHCEVCKACFQSTSIAQKLSKTDRTKMPRFWYENISWSYELQTKAKEAAEVFE